MCLSVRTVCRLPDLGWHLSCVFFSLFRWGGALSSLEVSPVFGQGFGRGCVLRVLSSVPPSSLLATVVAVRVYFRNDFVVFGVALVGFTVGLVTVESIVGHYAGQASF